MTVYEQQEIASLPPKYRPLGAWTYFLYSLLFCIPIVGFICLIVFSVSDSNINRRSYARSFFCGLIIILVISVIAAIIGGGTAIFESILRNFR